MNDDGNIVESQATESYVMAPDGFVALAENRKFQLGDVRIECRNQVMYYTPPASRSQIEAMIDQAECIEWPLYEDWGRKTRPVWLPLVLEGLEGLTFRHESRGAHNGQSDMSLYAQEGDTVVGYIDYSVFGDEIYIQYIHVNEDKRRGGIATAMAMSLQAKYPDKEINWGMSTDQGTAFLQTLDREFQPDLTYAEVKAALDLAKVEYAALQVEMDAQDFSAMTPEQKQPYLEKGQRMNELDDLIYGLEDQLRDRKPGKWRVLGESEMSPDEMNSFVKHALTLSNDWVLQRVESAALGWVNQYLLTFNDPTNRLLSSTAFVRDQGLNEYFEPPVRDVWVKIHLAAKNQDEHFRQAFGDQYDYFDFDHTFGIMPNELENLKAAIKDGFVKILKRALMRNEIFDLSRYLPVLTKFMNRIVAAFKAKTI